MADLITGAEFGRLFHGFSRTAQRLETRGRYYEPEEQEALRRFLAGEPEDPNFISERDHWLAGTVKAGVDEGKSFARVRIVSDPLTSYMRFELAGFRHNVEAGEEIRLVGRARANALDLPDHDFWLFDDERVALMYFTADDRRVGVQLVAEPGVVRQHARWFAIASKSAMPYRESLARGLS